MYLHTVMCWSQLNTSLEEPIVKIFRNFTNQLLNCQQPQCEYIDRESQQMLQIKVCFLLYFFFQSWLPTCNCLHIIYCMNTTKKNVIMFNIINRKNKSQYELCVLKWRDRKDAISLLTLSFREKIQQRIFGGIQCRKKGI